MGVTDLTTDRGTPPGAFLEQSTSSLLCLTRRGGEEGVWGGTRTLLRSSRGTLYHPRRYITKEGVGHHSCRVQRTLGTQEYLVGSRMNLRRRVEDPMQKDTGEGGNVQSVDPDLGRGTVR